MNYFTINYNVLKKYIQDNKNTLGLIDIFFLYDNNYINWQQYEDLATIVAIPMYDYKSFLKEDKGYYRQQGPLSIVQNNKDLLAKRMNRLIRRGGKND